MTNELEYAIYDENKDKLDLSVCDGINIKMNHQIKNTSLLDIETLSKYSEEGIDILYINDNFFNDICYLYIIKYSDIILKDRREDIYQNYSQCDSVWIYVDIDIETKIISCVCEIKTEIQTEVETLSFGKAVSDTFKQSNFFVIKCYELVFDFNNKSSNYGF